MSESSFPRILESQILECRWPDVAERWIQYLPLIEPPGSAPSEPLTEFIGFTDIARSIGKDYSIPLKAEVAGLREYVFRDGVFLLHKALHVVGCAETDVKRGHKTWALPNAYQAALFGAKAVSCFCGIGFAEFESKGVLVDIFPKETNIQKRRGKLKLKLLDDPAIQFTKFNLRFEHSHIWAVFKRILGVFQMGSVWPPEFVASLARIENKDFSRQRNALNYSNSFWIFDDLHDLVIDPIFGEHPLNIEKALVSTLKSDFSIVSAMVILRMAILLLESISSRTNILAEEMNLVNTRIVPERHPLYLTAFGY